MKKLRLAKTRFNDFSQTALLNYANKHRLAISVAPGSTNFPDIPADAAALSTLITNYRLTLSAAYKGSKSDTIAKDAAKEILVKALQVNRLYVNQTAQNRSGSFANYAQFAAFTTTSGFDVNGDSTSAGPLAAPMIRSLTSPAPGELKVIFNKFSKSGKQRTKEIPGVNAYEISYRTAAVGVTPPGPWLVQISTAYFSTITALASGPYDVQARARGANRYSSVTSIRSLVVL